MKGRFALDENEVEEYKRIVLKNVAEGKTSVETLESVATWGAEHRPDDPVHQGYGEAWKEYQANQ